MKLEIKCLSEGIKLYRETYLRKVLYKLKFSECKPEYRNVLNA